MAFCYLQGKTQDEAARLLGVSTTTIKKRLESARALLRQRLVRRGLGPAVVLALAGWPAATVAGTVPFALADSTVKAASLFAANRMADTAAISANVAALAEGVLKTMFVTKVKTVMAVLFALGMLWVGGGLCIRQMAQGSPDEPIATSEKGPKHQGDQDPAAEKKAIPPAADKKAQANEDEKQRLWPTSPCATP